MVKKFYFNPDPELDPDLEFLAKSDPDRKKIFLSYIVPGSIESDTLCFYCESVNLDMCILCSGF